MTQNNLGTAYTYLPAATADERAKNVRAAIDCYQRALEIRKKDEYPVQYATTQNNLGNAYTALPSATAEERAKNVRAAIDCYQRALEIRKKDEYPQYYCQTAANLGIALASIGNPDACYWLKEAYALREYLEDQGKRLEEIIRQTCKKELE
ncbi:MAG: tetratricopeptide repeat protein, partial [Sedimentisphaerales bacterium]|nr:tetratricopeptide repeat protein [Sedimentisphaerales bacterium]